MVGEAVQRLTVSVASGGSVVLALVEESAGLLSAQAVEVKADAVQGEDGRRFAPIDQPGFAGWKLLEFANVRIDTVQQVAGGEMLFQAFAYGFANVEAIEGLCEHLHRKYVVVFVYDQAGQQIGLAEDHSIGVGVAYLLLAKPHSGV